MLASLTIRHRNILLMIVCAAFIARAATFLFFTSHENRYRQPDSPDYHVYALSFAAGTGMYQLDNKTPMFWRTPGYPAYVGFFYKLFGLNSVNDLISGRKGTKFEEYADAHNAAIWVQLILCSFTPLLVYFLIQSLTTSPTIALITAGITGLHIGFVLASTYLLTEGLAILFFYLFLFFLFRSFWLKGQTKTNTSWHRSLIAAGLFLGITTWIRPMGEFVAIVSILLILIFDTTAWKERLKKIALFGLVFLASISPWYIRNYQLTGKWFFCPMPGAYFITFSAPKILRRTMGIKLEHAINLLMRQANQEAQKEKALATLQGKNFEIRTMCSAVAFPILLAHPWYAMIDWMKEVAKTTFDLYASQLTAMAAGTHTWDPVEEFLSEKLAADLYAQKMPLSMRIICWLEALFSIILWMGLIAGASVFWIYPLIKRFNVSATIKQTGLLWLKVAPMISAIVFMTGGFGYARLRLPVEPLIIMLSLTFWIWLIQRKKGK